MKSSLRVVLSLACLSAALMLLQSRSQGEAMPLRRGLETFPARIGAWLGQEATLLEVEVLNVLKVNDYLMRRYVDNAGRSLWLYVGYWETQRKGAQPHSPKNCLPGSGWEPLEVSILSVPVAGGRTLAVNRLIVQKSADREVVLYWYRAQGSDVAGEVSAKISMVRNAITRNRTDGALIRVSSPVQDTVEQTSDRLVAYVQAMYPTLAEFLPD